MDRLTHAICWTLVHSIWQGIGFALLGAITIMATRNNTPRIRYNIITALFFTLIIICGCTFLYEWNQVQYLSIIDKPGSFSHSFFPAILNGEQIKFFLQSINQFLSSHASTIVFIWLIVFFVKATQTINAIFYTQRIRHLKTHAPTLVWQEKVSRFAKELQLKKNVLLLESELVKIPVVIGHFKPIIFIPLGLLTQLPADQVEAVLWHELAHIRRNDYLVNFLQTLCENVFFFNPGLLWISAMMRTERENCCDDIAIDQTKNKKQFIEALISFKEYAVSTSRLAPAFPGKKNQLLQRVTRIIHHQNKTLYPLEKICFLFCSLLLVLLFSITIHEPAKKNHSDLPIYVSKTSNNQTQSGDITEDNRISMVDNSTAAVAVKIFPKTSNENALLPDKNLLQEKLLKESSLNSLLFKDKFASLNDESSELHEQQIRLKEKEQFEKDQMMALRDEQQAQLDHIQQMKDDIQAIKDQKMAEVDQQLAERDAKQAKIDKELAERNAMRGNTDRAKTVEAMQVIKNKMDRKQFH